MRQWELDLDAMARAAGWARQRPELLAEEVRPLLAGFPTFLAAAGRRLDKGRCWVEAAEPLQCDACQDLIVFDRGTRCATCEQPAPAGDVVGFVGRIPALITGRPFGAALDRRLETLREEGDTRAATWSKGILSAGGHRYLAPRYGLWFSQSWPHSDPPVMVWPEYFEVLGIPPDHVYHAAPFHRLCLFATWREQPACQVLQNRVVPRLLIDLMVADLQALDRLDDALDTLDVTLYQLYNMVGRPGGSDPLRRVYDELVGA
ncbi:MAG: hypothetical protein IT371_02830 [Deltaproteobacteria bacterium]|nr:hypothetical protein [Deltaproteobacteria bacterium]